MTANYYDNRSLRKTQLTDALFQKFSALVYEKAGIYLKPEKKELLNARLGKRLRALGIDSFSDYYNHVVHDTSGEELVQMIDVVSTNFTSFFRENSHFEFMADHALPDLVARRNGKKEVVIWSAASSSGEEPYTIALVAEDFFEQQPGWGYRIMATDISTRVLAHAQRGVYPMDRVVKVPKNYLKKYFQRGQGRAAGHVRIKDALRRRISFERFNLMDQFPWNGSLDIIFCRNVMIYFNRETQQQLVNKFYQSLAPGGYLFIGHSESISSLKHNFVPAASTVYRKAG
ncbi:CheR family methyltransferase [Desulfurivibrio alkaliphilus]|uniref:protein-glutamate O-methyltransferase n=1 Tax=Desulfurivibrio alkaliphilus (strain DSM 19089 / UNIQEM U267 / AHT2) TaxID=589865 RepID=D6Z4A2_DESAT|nr:protein-glutamate O-methyltransferase [Desulfurivibrio alkaliphilus]ADH86377.1 MCP methyltransferase, CheR-type [Desulfurivibrio alkaliphilus AHT 2]